MLRDLVADLHAALAGASASQLLARAGRLPDPLREAASFSSWLPYAAYIAERQVFVNRDSLGFCLELRPQSGADEEMVRVLSALYAALPAGTGVQFHLFGSPAVREPLARYGALRLPDEPVSDSGIRKCSEMCRLSASGSHPVRDRQRPCGCA